MSNKRTNGEGSIYQRKDGRFGASATVTTLTGKRKRVHAYAKTAAEARRKLTLMLSREDSGILSPDSPWTVGRYLNYWIKEVVPVVNRPLTAERYETLVRRYLVPQLGSLPLATLGVRDVQVHLDTLTQQGVSPRVVQQVRTTLSSALTRAQREELVQRNVARLTLKPKWERKEITPWTVEQLTTFLNATEGHMWHGAFLMLANYGLRRGEVLGLGWEHIDFDAGVIRIRQQLQRVNGTLRLGDVKTSAGRRDLPLLPPIRAELLALRAKAPHSASHGPVEASSGLSSLVFRGKTGQPVDPHGLTRTFLRISKQVGLPRITVHHLRHTTATLLKNLGVPPRDAQLILGHSSVLTTQQLYQHGDLTAQRDALMGISEVLANQSGVDSATVPRSAATFGADSDSSCQNLLSHVASEVQYA
ncbi:tyrosine-type recombinase/integrase [Gulosibacter molinativorax]|uniref:Site-specific integrase n=1 Tax=Gulosibacter molinativorax TaxID=256821 RepID=A0ABT7CBT9_9MICO|nr:site-specific integrase [Gulosibacter molinativorax]MDJ1372665.1 site-specific integrase [Gulosibacter molinativorax]QUY62401.1 Site-specific recombinase XerD [Gulosibacter molinativorax]